MRNLYLLGSIMIANIAGGLTACADEPSAPSELSASTIPETVSEAAATGVIRLRCERRDPAPSHQDMLRLGAATDSSTLRSTRTVTRGGAVGLEVLYDHGPTAQASRRRTA